jgi:glutaredoxin
MSEIPEVVIFSKSGCGLCEKAKGIALRVKEDIPFSFREIDITTDPELFARYRYVIPVLAIDGKDVFVSKISELRLRKALARRRKRL